MWRSLFVALLLGAASAATRSMLLAVLPDGAWSADLHNWPMVAQSLRQGLNPYNVTGLLNWPPLWMQVIFVLDHVSTLTHHRLERVIQAFLVALEGAVTLLTYLLLNRHWAVPRAWLLVLVGLVLDPVAFILTTVHGNFDLIVGLAVLLFTWSLTSWHRRGQPEDWLLACLFLGAGILVKTAPAVLIPLLAVGWRRLNVRHAVIGATLVAWPTVLGLSILLSLGPQQVLEHVIRYRSAPGFFGISGLLGVAHWPYSLSAYTLLFACLLAAAAFAGVRSIRCERDLVLVAACLLVLVPVVGPGYAPQYAWWWLAPLALVFALSPRTPVRPALLVLFVVSATTYAVDYGLSPSLGGVLLHWPHPAAWNSIAEVLNTPQGETWLRLPQFLAYVAFVLVSAITLWQSASRRPAEDVDGGLPSGAARLRGGAAGPG